MTDRRSTATAELQGRGTARLAVLADFLELTKPRIASFVFLAAVVGALLAQGPAQAGAALAPALEAAFWIVATAGASSVFNQVFEIDTDRLMERTRERPLPSGRMRTRDAVLFGTLLGVAGVLGLALRFNLLVSLLALATLASYALVYTPLKRTSSLNTVVGAIPGAMPPLLGYVALAGEPGAWGWTLFAILFAWQFPHFMAIAWLYREDYARAKMQMLPAIEGGEGLAGRQAVAYSLVLLAVSLLPGLRGEAGWVYTSVTALLGLVYMGASVRFALHTSRDSARAVLLASLVYLPLVFSFVLMDPVVHRALG